MAKIYWKGSALLAPLPSVMVTCGTNESSNILTVGWCGVVSTKPPKVYISVRPERHSYAIIKDTREFVINLVPSSFVEICDYVGTVTGKCVDKAAKTGLSLIKSREVSAPTIENSPLSLECKVESILPQGSHDMFIATVSAVLVDEELVAPDGKLRLDKRNLLVYSHGEYFELGKKLGPIGLSVAGGKKGRAATVDKAREKSAPLSEQKTHTKKR